MTRTTAAGNHGRRKSLQTNLFRYYVAIVLTLSLSIWEAHSFTARTVSSRTSHRRTTAAFMTLPIEAWNRFLDEDDNNSGASATQVLEPPPQTTLPELGADGVYHIENEDQFR